MQMKGLGNIVLSCTMPLWDPLQSLSELMGDFPLTSVDQVLFPQKYVLLGRGKLMLQELPHVWEMGRNAESKVFQIPELPSLPGNVIFYVI